MKRFSLPKQPYRHGLIQSGLWCATLLLLTCALPGIVHAQEDEDAEPVAINIADPDAGATDPMALSAAPAAIQRIDFNRDNNGTSAGRLSIQFDGPGAVPALRSQGSRIVVDIDNVSLSTQWTRPMNVANFSTPVQRVEARPSSRGAQIILITNREFETEAFHVGNEYVVEVKPRSQEADASPSAASVARAANNIAGHGYTGTPITFNFQDVPVRTVLQLIAEESQLNLVVADNVSGNVTLRLDSVPWDQALDIVLRAKGLDKRRDDKVIWVAPQPELAAYERSIEDARIDMENRVDLVTDYIQINYHSVDTIQSIITSARGIGGAGVDNRENGFMSPRGMLVADSRTNTLLVSDIPKKVEQMRELISIIDKPVDQVLIEGRIVVATDSFARDLGISHGLTLPNAGRGGGGSININMPPGGNFFEVNHVLLDKNFSLTQHLNVMQREGRGEIVSNPRIVTANQREATIQQGQEVGYMTVTGGGGGGAATPSVEFKEVLLELKVTPTITPDGRVFLDMNIKKDDLGTWIDIPGFGRVPSLQRREINTAVLVEDGQTVVIGGVYEFMDSSSVAKVPWLGDIPFLGNLFKTRGRSREKAELLIFVTPKVMRVQTG